jgi:predicted secreted acid phosphatase
VFYTNPKPRGRGHVDFDDYDAKREALVDYKSNEVRTTKKTADQAMRQLEAARQNGIKTVIWRVQSEKQKRRAEKFLERRKIQGITIEVRP